MTRMANQKNGVTLLGIFHGLDMNLGHKRTCGVDGMKIPLLRDLTDLGGNSVGRKEQVASIGHFVQGVDENCSLGSKRLDDVFVVNNLVIDIDGGPKFAQSDFQTLNRHVNASAKTTRARENDFHLPSPLPHLSSLVAS